MSTPATISILLDHNRASTINVRWDGYPEGVGTVLLESYNTEEQVKDLIAQGEVSSLDHTLTGSDFALEPTESETYDVDNLADLEEYNYLWANDEWLVAVNGLWYKLPYYIEADVGVLTHYLADKDPDLA